MTPAAQTGVAAAPPNKTGLVLRVGIFALIYFVIGMVLLPFILIPIAGLLVASALSVFGGAVAANGISVRIFDRGGLADVGLRWGDRSGRETAIGIGVGMAAATLVMVAPLVTGMARFVPAQSVEHRWESLVFVSVVLLFGAVGEEMVFHGYAFQLLIRALGPFATILPMGVLFGLVHMANLNVNALGVLNTMAWGVVLGFAYLRTRALWLPIGLHFGWNFTLPLFGANLSGFTMGMTGYALEWRASDLWSGGGYGPEGSILTTMAVLALAYVLQRLFPPIEDDGGSEEVSA
jgi:uncharacterized protein